ncbi:hypothetical protein JB92DRAFT_3061858, partial [Gautieria morchelliformis]
TQPTTFTSLWVSTEVINNTQKVEHTQTQVMTDVMTMTQVRVFFHRVLCI